MRVVIIDSIAFHFRQDVADAAARGRVLGGMAQTLHQLAYEHDVGVVVINHVTTKFDKAPTPSEAAVEGGIITRQTSNAIVSSEHSMSFRQRQCDAAEAGSSSRRSVVSLGHKPRDDVLAVGRSLGGKSATASTTA